MTGRLGAYGFAFRGMEEAESWMVDAPDDWPDVCLEQTKDYVDFKTLVGQQEAHVRLVGGRGLHVTRHPPVVRFIGSTPLTHEELIHPFLSPAASVLADWHGWVSFHAGAFVVDGKAWLVAAEREGGKSTTLAALAEGGWPVLADDLVVLKGDMAMSGPRSIDLRVPGPFQSAEDLGEVGRRRRWRLALPPVEAETPVGGILKLGWSHDVVVRPVPIEDRAETLGPSVAVPVDSRGLLRLISIPAFEIWRPRGDIEDTLRLVVDVASP